MWFLLALSILPLISALPQAVIPQSGCGKSQFLPGVTQYRFNMRSSGKSRSYSYHLPSKYDPNKKYPVVLGFHGSSSTGLFFELDTKMSQERFSKDKIMIYPNGIQGSWAGPTYHTDTTVEEDIIFVQDVVTDIQSKFCVDPSRIYAAGMSNGGGFIGTLACSATGSNLFAAFAAHSAALYTEVNGPNNGCNPARKPVPILEIHGGSDKTVKYGGGQGDGGPEPPIPSWLDWWVERNSCNNKTEESSHGSDVHHLSWDCKGVPMALQHYKVDSLGHAWADTEPNLSQISVPQGPTKIQASAIIMDFFNKFVKSG